ncbi:MAG: hypothetical protein HZA15_11240 [Nitrospirae bacterium]|nr:hypothetical protein [Nitrospirota bacterium]
MSRTKSFLSHLNLINITLAGVLIVLVNYVLLPFLNEGMQYSLPVIARHERPDPGADKKAEQTRTSSPLDYVIIAEQNLFHPERKIPADVKEAPPLPKPDFVLYGTLISGDLNIAYIEDKKSPLSTPGRGNRQRALIPGQNLSGYTLNQIYVDRVILTRGDDRIEVMVTEGKDKSRAKQKPASPPAQQKKLDGSALNR